MAATRVPIADLQPHRWHKSLPPEASKRAAALFASVGRHFSPTVDEWVDGFCYDLPYMREIEVWERLAAGWNRFRREHPDAAAKNPRELITVMMAGGMGEDVSDRPYAKQLLSCLRHPTKGKK